MTTATPLERILTLARAANAWPRVAVYLADCPDRRALEAAVERIPGELRAVLAAIYVYFDLSAEEARELGQELSGRAGWEKVTVVRAVRDYGYGGNRKVGLTFALESGFDLVAVLSAGDDLGPDGLARLLLPALESGAALVRGARSGSRLTLGESVANFVLNLRLRDWHGGPRVCHVAALRRVPFLLNDDDASFDAQLTVQIKSLGERLAEVALPALSAGGPETDALATACSYRLHQLHLRRHGRWLVHRGENYTFKKSPYSSHRRILDTVPAGSSVLDLGCSQGLLAHELEKKGCRVVGVDRLPAAQVRLPYAQYHQADLDAELQLPYGREFDVVIVSDVIEHLLHRELVIAAVRRHLREEGRLIISTGNVAIWFYRVSLLLGRFEYGPRGILDETHVRLFTQATFERLVRQAGFEIVRRHYTPLPFELVFETRADSWFIRALDRAYHGLARLWPAMFAYQFVLEARIARLEPDEAAGAGQ